MNYSFFSLLVLLAALLGFWVPGYFRFSVPYIPYLLGLVMFGMGLTLSPLEFKNTLKSPKSLLSGAAAQYLLMPLAALIIVKSLDFSTEIALGIILVGTCPGGTASNVITFLAKGDVALSVSMTTLTTLLSPILTPILTMLLAGKLIQVDVTAMFYSILIIVILPITSGVILSSVLKKGIQKILNILPIFSMISIAFIVAGIVAINRERISHTGFLVIMAVILHNGFGLLSGYLIGKALLFNRKVIRTISIEVGMQNSGLAVSLALLHFSPESALPAAIFSVWHNVSGSILASFWVKS